MGNLYSTLRNRDGFSSCYRVVAEALETIVQAAGPRGRLSLKHLLLLLSDSKDRFQSVRASQC
jgi:hypothetical protein